jgi:hypothetical protein
VSHPVRVRYRKSAPGCRPVGPSGCHFPQNVGRRGLAAAQATAIILDGVRSGAWRIRVGEEAKILDTQVRANPEAPFNYENYAEMYGALIAQA